MQIDLTEPIKPGMSAAGIRIGQAVEALPRPLKKVSLSAVVRFDYSCVSVWVRQGFVDQVGVRQGYSGELAEGISIGSSIADVERLIGAVEEDSEDNLIVVGYPGWCFETEQWLDHRIEDNRGARITEIFVHKASK